MRGAMDKIIVRRLSQTSVNSEGVPVNSTVNTEVKGSFHIRKTGSNEIDPNEIGKFGQILKGVVRLPLGTDLKDGDLLVVDSFQDKFDGNYEIENFQYTRTHLRVEVRRSRT
jgi:hypothetical protein